MVKIENCGVQSLAGLFVCAAESFPDRPSVWVAGRTISYAELRIKATSISEHIMFAGRRSVDVPAKPIAVFAYRSVMSYAAVIGTLLAGGMYTPLNPHFPVERNRSMLDASGAEIVLVDERCRLEASQVLATIERRLTVILLDDFTLAPDLSTRHNIRGIDNLPRPFEPPPLVEPTNAYLLFTSGSTGTPKGVLVTQRNVLAYVAAIHELFGPDSGDRFCHLADLTFDISVHDMFVCWSAGACLFVVPERDIAAPAAFVRAHQLTFWFSVPSAITFMEKFGTLGPGSLASLRCSFFCGEALFEEQARAWHRAATNSAIHNLYGPTEATVAITHYHWQPDARVAQAVVPMGEPFPPQQVALVDDRLMPVDSGAIGEVCLGGSQVAPGYWRDEIRTAERFVRLPVADPNVWYRTGDLARWDERDGLIFHGRVDQQIKVRGFRVELGEVESILREALRAGTVVAVGWPEDANGVAQNITAFVAVEGAFDEGAAMRACQRNLPDYMVPRRVLPLATMPLNANGKVDRMALKAMLREGGARTSL